MSKNVITVSGKTAQAFLPADRPGGGQIDLGELAAIAKTAMDGSDRSLQAAQAIADGGWLDRFLHSGDMQRHVIESITYIRDISKVNLGLSAICNDLAAANLEHASRIDKNHHATNQQLSKVQQLTGELLEHLRQPRQPGLLERLLPALTKINPADQKEIQGWLRTLTEEIDLQYAVLQENLDKLVIQNDHAAESISRASAEVTALHEVMTTQKAAVSQQIEKLTSSLTASVSETGQRADKTDAAVRKSHEVLAAALVTLNQQVTRHKSEFQAAVQLERTSREAMQQSVLSLIKQREGAIRTTVGELNQHLLKRMLFGAGGIVAVQILGFGFLAFKMGLFQ